MDWLNYHHLLYFWMVAREGSLAAACKQLHLAQPTLSSQIRKLEQSLGVELFSRRGRSLELTETGQAVYRYADEIFSLGRELQDVVSGRRREGGIQFVVGVPDILPKLIVYHLLLPALDLGEEVHLVTYEGKLAHLLSDLATHKLDVVISETPLPQTSSIRAFNHLLGECTISCFGTRTLAAEVREGFPRSLDGAPMLLPTQNTAVRRALDQWFDQEGLNPRIKHEFEDSGLMKVFGQAGHGIFPAPTAIARQVCHQYHVEEIGTLVDVTDRFYAISVERRLKHPAVVALRKAARNTLFVDRAPA